MCYSHQIIKRIFFLKKKSNFTKTPKPWVANNQKKLRFGGGGSCRKNVEQKSFPVLNNHRAQERPASCRWYFLCSLLTSHYPCLSETSDKISSLLVSPHSEAQSLPALRFACPEVESQRNPQGVRLRGDLTRSSQSLPDHTPTQYHCSYTPRWNPY